MINPAVFLSRSVRVVQTASVALLFCCVGSNAFEQAFLNFSFMMFGYAVSIHFPFIWEIIAIRV